MKRRRLLPLVANILGASSSSSTVVSAMSIDASVQLAQETMIRLRLPPAPVDDDDEEETNANDVVHKEPSQTSNGSHPHSTVEQAEGDGQRTGSNADTPTNIDNASAPASDSSKDKRDSSSSSPTTTTNDDDDEEEDKNLTYDGSDLIEWINTNGGYIHPNARIGLDPTGQYRGVFVKNDNANEDEGSEGIDDGDVIASIPWDLIIKPKNYDPVVYWSCEALRELHHQFILGDQSKFAPYVNYLKNQPRGRIPSEWTPPGKQLLDTILDRDPEDDLAGLPPQYYQKEYEETWIGECGEEDSDLAKAAFYQFTSRDEDTMMVPFYDMHNHSNDPAYINTISEKPKENGEPFILRAWRDISPGEQIFISYNRCNACWFDETYTECPSHSNYGTSEVFDVFGFVEFYPQQWTFNMKIDEEGTGKEDWDQLKLCIEEVEYDDDEPAQLLVTFGDNYSEDVEDEMPVKATIEYLGDQLVRLRKVEDTMKNDGTLMESMPKHEWDTAWRYHEALMTAIGSGILASDFAMPLEEDGDSGDDGLASDNAMALEEEEDSEDGDWGDSDSDDEDSRDDSGDEEEEEMVAIDKEGRDEL